MQADDQQQQSHDSGEEPIEPATRAEFDAAISQELEQRARAAGVEPLPNTAPELQSYAAQRGLRVNAPARPDLGPGETVTTVPDRYCERCDEPRGGRKCHACGALTITAFAPEEAPRYEHPPLVRRAQPARAQSRVRFYEDEEDELDEDELEEDELDEAEPVRAPRFTQRRAPMNQRQQQRRHLRRVSGGGDEQLDEYGYPVQDTVSRRGRGGGGRRVRSAEDELSSHWRNGNVMLDLWWSGFSALLHGAQSVEDVSRAADLADAAYIEMMARQR